MDERCRIRMEEMKEHGRGDREAKDGRSEVQDG